MNKGKLMTKENNVKKYPETIDTRVTLLENSMAHISETLKRIETDIKEIKKDMKYDFRFVIGAICALGAVMAHGFHWF